MGRPKRLVIKARASVCSPSQTEPCDLTGSSGLGKRKCAAWDDNFMTQYSPPDPFHPLPTESLFESALSRTYANSAVSALSLEQALACKTGFPLLARSLWARFRQPRRQGFLGQTIEIPHSNRL